MYWLNPQQWFRRPHPFITRNHKYFSEFSQSLPLSEYSFVAFDTELTGLDRKKDEIISIGAVRIANLKIDFGDTFYQVVQPEKVEHNVSTLVHQISPSQLREARSLAEVLPEFIDFIGDSLIIGHYLDLDMSHLNRATWKHMAGTLSTPGIDTMWLVGGYRRIQRGYFKESRLITDTYVLEELNKQYQLPPFSSHNAFEDAVQTACLFLYLVKKMKKSGLATLRDLYKVGHNLQL